MGLMKDGGEGGDWSSLEPRLAGAGAVGRRPK